MNTDKPRWAPRLAALLVASAMLSVPVAHAQDGEAPPAPPPEAEIDNTRDILEKWVEIRQNIAKEKTKWAETKEVLTERIELMKRSIEKVRQDIENKRTELAGFDEKIEALEEKNEALKQASEELERLTESMEERTLALLGRVPAPLVKQVRPLALQIPGYSGGDDDKPEAEAGTEEEEKGPPLARRVETVVGVLYLFNKYSDKIEQTKETVQQGDKAALVSTLYLGLSYGYYTNDDGTAGAWGAGGPEGWVWTPVKPESAAAIKQAISVFNKDEPAAFVDLPVEVK